MHYTTSLPAAHIDILYRSIGYVEFRTIDLVEKAIALKGTVVMGLPIMVKLTESERNKLHPGDGYVVSHCELYTGLTAPL